MVRLWKRRKFITPWSKASFWGIGQKNIKNIKNESENKKANNHNNKNNNIGINMSMNINNFNINTTMNNSMAQNPKL